jgi:hypothetical protein
MKVTDNMSDAVRIRKSKNKVTPVTQIGKCVGCGDNGILAEGACLRCRNIYGAKSGKIMAEIRSDKDFARYVFGKIRTEDARRIFIEWFGDPTSSELKLVE